jgi:hypothetical protein
VPETELIHHTVIVLKDSMMMVPMMSTVMLVTLNVSPVLVPLSIVKIVPLTELMLLIVDVWTVWLNKETYVLLVTIHVKLVLLPLTIVMNVLTEETNHMNVNVL